MVNLTINNKKVQVPEGTTILAAAAQVPYLCGRNRGQRDIGSFL